VFSNFIEKWIGKRIDGLETNSDHDAIVLVSGEDRLGIGVEGDCCSISWIEHFTGASGFKPGTLVKVEEKDLPEPTDEDLSKFDVLAVYSLVLTLDNGLVLEMEYRNNSNGYYGGFPVQHTPRVLQPLTEDF
jgi:hypothetical protein